MFSLGRAKGNGGFWGALVGLAFGLFMASSPVMVQAGELSAAPVNPEFTQYMQNQRLRLVQGLSAEGHALSYIPSPLKLPSAKAEPLC